MGWILLATRRVEAKGSRGGLGHSPSPHLQRLQGGIH